MLNRVESEDELLVRKIQNIKLTPPQWDALYRIFDVVFDVRDSLTTLRELLHELKILRNYLNSNRLEVCVVANQIEQPWVDILTHEGFYVLSKKDYESNRANRVGPE